VSAVPSDVTALDVVRTELDAARSELDGLVAGVAPADLGGGRLAAALEGLARRCYVPTAVSADPRCAGSASAEQTLYYVAAESLANALKHSGAAALAVSAYRDGDHLVVEVSDDGRGGADPNGLGLLGLADRVAAARGRLTVTSEAGRGTTVRAQVPATGSGSRG
jgi:signal transduction histidine kinase